MKKLLSIIVVLFLLLPLTLLAKDKDKKDKKYRGIDNEPPIGNVQIIPPIKGEYLNFTINTTDLGTGVYGLCISNFENCTDWGIYDGQARTVNWQLLPGTGLRTVWVYVIDRIGNKSVTKIMVIKEE